MRFLDTSSKDPEDTLAAWFRESTREGVLALYLQSGYFTAGSLDFLVTAISPDVLASCETHIVIGSNDPRTYAGDVERLVNTVGIPRHGARLGVVGFGDGLFHPKNYVIKRADGSLAAYIGSANFTPGGLSKNIEAGIILDSRDASVGAVCGQVADAITRWFERGPDEGFNKITCASDVQALVERGILSSKPLPPKTQPQVQPVSEKTTSPFPVLKPLVSWPRTDVGTKAPVKAPPTAAPEAAPKKKPATPATSVLSRVLVAEITGGRVGRDSRQIDLKKAVAEDYFGGVGAHLTCTPVTREGVVGTTEHRIIGTKSSANYYVELRGQTEKLNQEYRERPLLMMAQYALDTSDYLYFWLEPEDPRFDLIYDHYITPAESTRKGKQSIKLVESYDQLARVWADNPFALALLKAGT